MTFGFLVFILSIVAGQLLAIRAVKTLSAEQKALLVDTWSGRMIGPLLMIAVLYGLMTLVSTYTGYFPWLTATFIAVMFISTGGFMLSDY